MRQYETANTLYEKTIVKFMNKFGCRKINRYSGNWFSGYEGEKIIEDCSYEIAISSDTDGAIYIVVTCSKPVRKDQIVEALKIINSSNIYEIQAKYSIGVNDEKLSCTTIHPVDDTEQSIYKTLDSHVECSIGNLESIYDMLDDESSKLP
jgi:hypothetical protein